MKTVTVRDLRRRWLDRLHLATMDELGIHRLLTNDNKQAAIAQQFGYEVVSPGA